MPFVIKAASNHASKGIYIALGANQAYRGAAPLENLNSALAALVSQGVDIIAASRPWRTPAWPDPSDPPFVNGAVQVRTDLDPAALMNVLHGVETRFGRIRGRRNAPRSIDLDLIDYRGQAAAGEGGGPILPHPRAVQRAFVLLPLREIAPRWRDPVTGANVDQLVAALPLADRSACRPAGGFFYADRAG
ncbi:2-amino-4-hydroxy-6-hydroxymethyldihydropteridine diphosphokinase [Maricaulaceae bacterium MS644]